MLLLILTIPLFAAILIVLRAPARVTALLASLATFALALYGAMKWQLSPNFGEASYTLFDQPEITLSLGFFDGISVVLTLLASLVLVVAVLSGKCPQNRERIWYSGILLIGAGAIGAFLSTNLFFFYAFHELALIPTFLLIGIFGKGDRADAAWKITLYLALASILLLVGLLWLVQEADAASLSFSDLLSSAIPIKAQIPIAGILLLSFGTLVSLFPFHSWAAPAYASAPAPVAILHAGVLKKFGLVGLIRLYPLISEGLQYWLTPLLILLLGNILWVGFITINQKRLSHVLGYSSVMHMGYLFLAYAALIAAGGVGENPYAMPALVVLMVAHGLSISLLFLLSSHIEESGCSVALCDLGGLGSKAPKLTFIFGIAAMASIGLPGLANFAGELLVFFSGFYEWDSTKPLGLLQIATILAIFGVIISAIYMLRAIRHIFHGPAREVTAPSLELPLLPRFAAIILAGTLVLIGVYPKAVTTFLESGQAVLAKNDQPTIHE